MLKIIIFCYAKELPPTLAHQAHKVVAEAERHSSKDIFNELRCWSVELEVARRDRGQSDGDKDKGGKLHESREFILSSFALEVIY